MHGKLMKKTMLFLCVIGLSYSCVDKDYDLDKIDGKFIAPNFPTPFAYMTRDAASLFKSSISDSIACIEDTIFLIYQGSFKLNPDISNIAGFDIWGLYPTGILDFTAVDIPSFVREQLQSIPFAQEDEVKINVFGDMPESVFKFSNPIVRLDIKNYTGYSANFTIDYLEALKESLAEREFASFNGNKNYNFTIEKASEPGSFWLVSKTFDKSNGINRLFGISPDKLIYSFSGTLSLPENGGFLVKDKYLDVDYEAKLPFAFDNGTKIVDTDTLNLDLSQVIDSNDLKGDSLILCLKCKNRMPAKVDVMITFLDENKGKPLCVTEDGNNGGFKEIVKAPDVDTAGYTLHQEAQVGDWVAIPLSAQQRDYALNEAKYLVLKYSIQTKEGAKASIRPSDYFEFKLAVSAKIHFEL